MVRNGIRNWRPGAMLLLDALYLAVLVVLLIGRQAHFLGIDRIPNPMGGIIPVGVPWWGALGALTISIYGIVDHVHDWDTKWSLWHAVRPFVGAILGTTAFLIFIGVLRSVNPSLTAPVDKGPIGQVPYLVIAFVVGFRESTFRELIQRVVDIFFKPSTGQSSVGISITPSPINFGHVAPNTASDITVTIRVTRSRKVRVTPAPTGEAADVSAP